MKKSLLSLLVFILANLFSFSQSTDTTAKPITKPSQAMFRNEIYGGYGAVSAYYFFGRLSHPYQSSELHVGGAYSTPASPGTFYIGFSRKFTKVVSMGFMFGYQNFNYSGTVSKFTFPDYKWTAYPADYNDNLFSASIRITFNYYNNPYFRIYSGIGTGVTIDLARLRYNGERSVKNEVYPACQLTFVGLRFGRDFGGFLELGAGSFGIINAGLSYKFSKPKPGPHLADTAVKTGSIHSHFVQYNYFYAGYGALSVFHYTGRSMGAQRFYETPQSWGSIHVGFSRALNKVVSLGYDIGYENFHYSGIESVYNNNRDTTWATTAQDQLITGIFTFDFCYLNKPFIRIYSRLGIGITIDAYKVINPVHTATDALPGPAGQITLLGVRFGRTIGGFVEFGYGSMGIVNAGLSYKFKD